MNAKENTISLVRRFSARHSLLDFAACFRICNEQLRRGVVSLLWVLLGFVCAFWLAVQLLLPNFGGATDFLVRTCADLINCVHSTGKKGKRKNNLLGETLLCSAFASGHRGLFSNLE